MSPCDVTGNQSRALCALRTYLRLHVNDTHLVLGLHRADRLDAGTILVLLVLPVFYKPVEGQTFTTTRITHVQIKLTQEIVTCCLKHLHQTAVLWRSGIPHHLSPAPSWAWWYLPEWERFCSEIVQLLGNVQLKAATYVEQLQRNDVDFQRSPAVSVHWCVHLVILCKNKKKKC